MIEIHMKNNASKTNSTSSDAKSNVSIVNGKLIFSLPNAQMPVVWQMDLDNAKSNAFTIQENKKDKNFALITKSQEGDINEIALFDDKQSAIEVLTEISYALQNAHSNINQTENVANTNTYPVNNSKDNKIGAGLAAALVIVLALIWIASASRSVNMINNGSTSSAGSSASNLDAKNTSGVAVSADDFLNNR